MKQYTKRIYGWNGVEQQVQPNTNIVQEANFAF